MALAIPTRAELQRRIPVGHPRILLDAGDLDRLRGGPDDPEVRDLVASLRAQAEADLASPLAPIELAPDLQVPSGQVWEVRYLLEGQAGFARAAAMGRPLGAACAQATRHAFLHRLTGQAPYRERARQALAQLKSLPLPATGYANTHTFHGATSALALGLDYLWEDLEAGEREGLVAALVARATEFHELSVRVALRDPLDSHAIMYGPPGMTHAALALYHHRAEAEDWLDEVLAYFGRAFPGFGGDDGGWGQGFGYGDGVHLVTMHTLWAATGAELFATPWARNNPRFMLYFQPPYGRCPNFGDAGYGRPKELQRQVMAAFARIHQDPYCAWFAEQIDAASRRDEIARISLHLKWPPAPPARPPRDLPQARHQRDIGWVVFHSDLADAAGNAMLQFKSSDFGSFSHSHADQNSLVVQRGADPLLIDSGYYPWYGSPHDMSWTRQTRAHNAPLVNGKGQGVWNRAAKGRILAFVHGTDFDYVAGDATAAYREPSLTTDTTSYHLRQDIHAPIELCAYYERVRRMVRHVVFVRPDAFVVLDEVETEAPARVQLMWHAPQAFAVDAAPRRAEVTCGASRARLTFFGDGDATLSQTDRFTVPPEHDLPNQWHLTVDWAATAPRRRLLTAIQVGAAGAELPPVEALVQPGAIGLRLGSTSVRFDLDSGAPRVACSGVRADGAPTWFEHSTG